MKTMTCRQLGGACDMEFHAETFEEIAKMSREHGMLMFSKGDADHIQAMKKMQTEMDTDEKMQQWMDEKRREFEGTSQRGDAERN